MATRTIDTKLTVTGEREYKQKLSEVNQSLKVLGSEMKLATAKFRDNADSVEALSARQEILSKRVDTQKTKVATLREALSKVSATYGEADRKTKDYQKSLNDAEAELADLNRELERHDEALRKANDGAAQSQSVFGRLKTRFGEVFGEAKPLGDVVGDLAGKFGVDLPEGLQSSLNGLGKVSPVALGAAGAITAIATAVVKVEEALINSTLASASYVDDLLTLTEQTGLSAGALQEFAYASELIDVPMDTLQGSLTELTMKMSEAAGGSEEARSHFANLGIDIRTSEGELRTANDVFYEAIDALGEMNNITERDAKAMELFGESAQSLNPLILRGSDALATYAKEAHDMGYVLDEDALSSLKAVDDAQQRLLKTQEAVSNQISAEYAPYMTEALGDTATFIKEIGKAFTDSGIVESFGEILTTATDLLEPLGALIKGVLPGLDSGLSGVAYTMALISDTLSVIVGMLPWNWGSGLFTKGLGLGASRGDLSAQQQLRYKDTGYSWDASSGSYSGNYMDNMAAIEKEWQEKGVGTSLEYYAQFVYGKNAAGTSNWRGGLTWGGENGPELVNLPRGAQVLTAQESRGAGGDVYNITIDAKSVHEFNDIVRIAQTQRRMLRMEGVQYGNG